MKYAIVENGVVTNIVFSDADQEPSWIICGDDVEEGWTYDGTFVAPIVVPPPAVVHPWDRLIDIGPFLDRFDLFGGQKIAILANPDVVVQAIIKDVMCRKWIDLARTDVGQAIDVIISKGHSVNKNNILNTPVADVENLALRKSFFGQ